LDVYDRGLTAQGNRRHVAYDHLQDDDHAIGGRGRKDEKQSIVSQVSFFLHKKCLSLHIQEARDLFGFLPRRPTRLEGLRTF
jgi:hypothetical protein